MMWTWSEAEVKLAAALTAVKECDTSDMMGSIDSLCAHIHTELGPCVLHPINRQYVK